MTCDGSWTDLVNGSDLDNESSADLGGSWSGDLGGSGGLGPSLSTSGAKAGKRADTAFLGLTSGHTKFNLKHLYVMSS